MSLVNLNKLRSLGWTLLASCAVTLSSCEMCELMHCRSCAEDECPGHARVCAKPTVRALAHDLDALESHIEKYGSVTIQHPTVWGQARLTRHREEFEKVMAQDLCTFKQTLQGSLSRTDQAFFANATSLGIAASGPQAIETAPKASTSSTATTTQSVITVPTPDAITQVKLVQKDPTLLSAIDFAGKSDGISTEPSVYLNQKARYLNHLHELRRINEGDDTGDSPGYALNLIRVPVSLLPGKHTQHGHGAEVTMTLKPHLSDELLPTTFRNLVVNDLLEQIGVPLTGFLNDPNAIQDATLYLEFQEFSRRERTKEEEAEKKQGKTRVREAASRTTQRRLMLGKHTTAKDQEGFKEDVKKFIASRAQDDKSMPSAEEFIKKNQNALAKLNSASISVTKLHHAKRPFPPSQIIEVYGDTETLNVATIAYRTIKRDLSNKYYVHYPDVQGYLQEELSAAYRFLANPENCQYWDFCNQTLVHAIHGRNVDGVEKMRDSYADLVNKTTHRSIHEDVTVALAWAIIVESALLTDQLVQDMKESAAAKNCPCPTTDWAPYYLPSPPADARAAFNRYVECRWPIIVFALDPVAEQQNIADSYSARRETQLALSLAFVSGQISAKNMTQYARRLEMDMETVALNNTAVGFSHGNETFGWRFYPRYQTPDTESNLTVLVRDQLIGGPNRNALLRQRKMEPGQRECTAVVIMPSFVPYATLEVSSNWFSLVNPKHKDMTCVEAVKMSARVRAIEKCSPNVIDANCYRDGELNRLMAKAKQLEARLPLQSSMVQIPYENTLGGFAMFNTGITDLAPELYGWYGAPGIDLNDSTTLFLIGNHFSPHQTRVVVGGISVTDTELLSRQVMRVTIPKGALAINRSTGTFRECPPADATKCPPKDTAPAKKLDSAAKPVSLAAFGAPQDASGGSAAKPAPTDRGTATHLDCEELFVDIHVATPYGVTSHLLVPACPTSFARGTSTKGADICPPATPPAKSNAQAPARPDRPSAGAQFAAPVAVDAPAQEALAQRRP